MERLERVIGPSPSEMPREVLKEKVKEIHSRVVRGLESGARAWGEKKRKASRKTVTKTMKAKHLEAKTGMTLGEIEEKLRKLEKLEKAQAQGGKGENGKN